MTHQTDTIVACATPTGGAIAVVRMSGVEAITIAEQMFRPRGRRSIADAEGYTAHYGEVIDAEGEVIDDVVLTLFRAPRSYTGENSVEISCHGSAYIAGRIVRRAIDCGARAATAGEFTTRAFLAGKIDLAQAEGVADMIASTDRATHRLALNQMRGGFSNELHGLRDELLRLSALLELELDFAEEEVEFADRTTLREIMTTIDSHLERLIDSFALGNALKEGIATAIVGAPNAGKSTLLNRLLNEERAMVSEIAGTTRDSIEESIVIAGRRFRVIDTAGIRSTNDRLEQMGIDRTFSSLRRAAVVLLVYDCSTWSDHE
ncbi:MAG: tRNA uridine-5-carboxymethylaminomethyl(34) synthesis GTPase MnmE, partial [Rikenellaceae bacterium]|nr:tRNA uridine-5-carboxymethylaminomethyl(34) synthesis GTPase MnmE [Rikenellaceae bacterium]